MTEKSMVYIIGDEPYFPKIHCKINKGDGKFLYCIILYILKGEEEIELCHCDNYHNKGNHIHYFKPNGKGEENSFDFKGIDKTIDYLKENWKKIMEDMKNE